MSSETIIGIDLGTTNSEVAIIRDGNPVVLDEDGDPILPSVVGLDREGRLLVGKPARNQYVLAPERTVRSIKRKMGQDVTVDLGDQKYSPQEISAIILRTLKARAEKVLGQPVTKAVITVPAFFNDGQRQATRQAGELAGLEVVRIINEPTAAVLTYDPHPPEMERLLVYDLGGGTFDVSVAQVEGGVVEIQASHGDTQLGRRRLRPVAPRPRLRRVREGARRRSARSRWRPRPGCCAPPRTPRSGSRSTRWPGSRKSSSPRRGEVAQPRPGDHPVRLRRPDPAVALEDADLSRRSAGRRQDSGQPDQQGRAGRRSDPHAAGPSTARGTTGAPRPLRDRARSGGGHGGRGSRRVDRRRRRRARPGRHHAAYAGHQHARTICMASCRRTAFSPIIERNTPLPASRTEIFTTVRRQSGGREDPRLPGRRPGHALQYASSASSRSKGWPKFRPAIRSWSGSTST